MNSENFSVPNDVSLISIDDTIIVEIYNLTSVIHTKEKIGKEAADLIFKGKLHTKKVYSPKLAEAEQVEIKPTEIEELDPDKIITETKDR